MHQKNGIFISYRRADSAGWATVIFEQIKQVFMDIPVFMDIDSIAPGQDFVDTINESLERAKLLLVLVGKNWLVDSSGKNMLDNADDFIRLEVEQALLHQMPVVPILVDGATLPDKSELPASLHPLLRRQAISIHNETYRADINRLIHSIRRLLEEPGAEAFQEAPETVLEPPPERKQETPPALPKQTPQPKPRGKYSWLPWLLLLIPLGYFVWKAIPEKDADPYRADPHPPFRQEQTFLEIQLLESHSEFQPELVRAYGESYLETFLERCGDPLLADRPPGWEGILRVRWDVMPHEDPHAEWHRNEAVRILETNIDREEALECLVEAIHGRRDQGLQQSFEVPVDFVFRFAVRQR